MFQPTAKRGFTIESLVAKDGGTGGGNGGGGAGSPSLGLGRLGGATPAHRTQLPSPRRGRGGLRQRLPRRRRRGRRPLALRWARARVPRSHEPPGADRAPGAPAGRLPAAAPALLLRRPAPGPSALLPLGSAEPLLRPPLPGERCAPGRAASARPLRAQAQEDPHGLLALAAAAPGARLREEPLRGGRRAEAAGRQPQPLGDAGEGVVPEPEDKVQAAKAGGGGTRVGAEEEGLPPHQPVAYRHQAGQRGGHRCHLQ